MRKSRASCAANAFATEHLDIVWKPAQGPVVPVVGLEPTLLAEPDFESGASTNSTTPARPGSRRRNLATAEVASIDEAQPSPVFIGLLRPARPSARWRRRRCGSCRPAFQCGRCRRV